MFKNKKGFTLIEMLVVIAIIAVLVAIIIPVIGNSTIKASAAANAANLRSYASEVAIIYLEPGDLEVTVDADTKEISVPETAAKAPVSKKMGANYTGNVTAKAYLENGQVVAKFGEHDVNWFADIASSGNVPGEKDNAG